MGIWEDLQKGWKDFTTNKTTQINPYTDSWMENLNNEQNSLKNMLFGGGGSGGILAGLMDPGSKGGWASNWANFTPILQGLTRTASDAEMAKASELGQLGQREAAAGFSKLGGLYSGANLLAGNQAYQTSMNDLGSKIASENFNLLGNLYGQSMGGFANSAMQGANNLFGLYGQNANNLAGASGPMFQQQKSGWDRMMDFGGMVADIGGAFMNIPGVSDFMKNLFPGGRRDRGPGDFQFSSPYMTPQMPQGWGQSFYQNQWGNNGLW
jgi:hypothetical protein